MGHTHTHTHSKARDLIHQYTGENVQTQERRTAEKYTYIACNNKRTSDSLWRMITLCVRACNRRHMNMKYVISFLIFASFSVGSLLVSTRLPFRFRCSTLPRRLQLIIIYVRIICRFSHAPFFPKWNLWNPRRKKFHRQPGAHNESTMAMADTRRFSDGRFAEDDDCTRPRRTATKIQINLWLLEIDSCLFIYTWYKYDVYFFEPVWVPYNAFANALKNDAHWPIDDWSSHLASVHRLRLACVCVRWQSVLCSAPTIYHSTPQSVLGVPTQRKPAFTDALTWLSPIRAHGNECKQSVVDDGRRAYDTAIALYVLCVFVRFAIFTFQVWRGLSCRCRYWLRSQIVDTQTIFSHLFSHRLHRFYLSSFSTWHCICIAAIIIVQVWWHANVFALS